jgi:hypothetical protein
MQKSPGIFGDVANTKAPHDLDRERIAGTTGYQFC